jgi:hypothetical protein
VAEDFVEPTGHRWRQDEEWTALAATKRKVSGHRQWRMRHAASGKIRRGFPSLHPFVEALPGGPSLARDWRVGMRDSRHDEAA